MLHRALKLLPQFILNARDQVTKSRQFMVSLLMGGILGNWIDRQFRPLGVVDMIEFYIPGPQFLLNKYPRYFDSLGYYHFPAFNIADAAICVGTISLVLLSLFGSRKSLPENAEGKPENQSQEA